MRVALIVHKFLPASVGGTEVYTHNVARELARRGHDVAVFYRHDSSGPEQIGVWEERECFQAFRTGYQLPIPLDPLSRFGDTFFNPKVEGDFVGFLQEFVPDVVHFQHLMLLSYRLVALAQQRRLPVLLTLHDYWYLCANSQFIWPSGDVCRGKAWGLNCARCTLSRSGLSAIQLLRPLAAPMLLLRDALVRRAALRVPCWIAPSRFLMRRYVQAGFPSERFMLLENGLDVQRIGVHGHVQSRDGRLRFTYLGSLAWQKGVHVLVEAFRGLSSDRALLRVYGDPQVFPEYSDKLRRLADSSNTRFMGAVPNEQVGRVLADTDVLVVPSLWYENSPLVVQEAFAAGVPVLASDLGALAEKVEQGFSGWLCAPGDVDSWQEALHTAMEQAHILQGRMPKPMTIEEHVETLLERYSSLA
jgi:glycosyltransferase involved in cell wall biosynthesis